MEFVKMSVATLNEVLAYLGKRPYEEVFSHVTKIQQEAQSWIQEAESAAKAEATKVEDKVKGFLGESVPAPSFPPVQEAIPEPQLAEAIAPVPQEAIPVPAQPAVAP